MMEKWKTFWSLVVNVWENGLYGIDIGRILVAIFIFLVFLLIRRVFSRFLIHRISLMTQKTTTPLDDHALEVLHKPAGFIPVVLGVYLATDYLDLSGNLSVFADRVIRSLIAFVIFWALVRLVKPMSAVLRGLEKVLSTPMVDWLVKAVHIACILIGGATILDIWGIEVGPIIAGFGLFGVAVALGAKDLFKNLISGILIIAEKRFHPGDWIKVKGVVEGTVETIGFRSTLVRRFDKAPVYVPNSSLSDNAAINFSAMTHRRIYWIFGVEYRTTVAQLRTIRDQIESYVLGSDDFAHPPEVSTFVRIDRFGDSSIDIMLYCFTRTTVWGKWLEIKEALAYQIKEIVEGAGTGFAFPSQSVYVETLPSETPELFAPPGGKKPG